MLFYDLTFDTQTGKDYKLVIPNADAGKTPAQIKAAMDGIIASNAIGTDTGVLTASVSAASREVVAYQLTI